MPTIKVDFTNLPKWTNPVYYPLYFNKDRYNILYGGAGSGKSHFEAQRIVYKTVAKKGTNTLVVRKTGKSNRVSTFALISQIISAWNLHKIFNINKSDMTITCKGNKNQIIFAGLDDVEKLKSVTFANGILTDIWCEEATEMSKQDIMQLNLRLRGQAPVPFQMTLSFNPVSALHWIKASYFDVTKPNCFTLKTTYKDNRFLDSEYKSTLKSLKDEDRTYYDIYCMGNWGVYGNLVFSNYKIHDFDINQNWDDIITGMDFGFNHYTAIEKIGIKNDELYFFKELYAREKTTHEIIQLNNDLEVLSMMDECTADSADPAAIKEWQDEGFEVKGAKKGKDSRKAGYTYLKTRKLHIHPSCNGIKSEIECLKYKEDKEGNPTDDVVEFKDDAFAAARYATERLWAEAGGAFAIITGIGV